MTTTELLVASLDAAYDKRSWHGTNLRGSLRGVTHEQAAWRVAEGRHNIWELTIHAAYWKYDIRRRLLGNMSLPFALEGTNFWSRPLEGTPGEWRADLALLHREHKALREAVGSFPAKRWMRKAPGKPFLFEGLVRGIAAHDLYHAGQIQLLKKLHNEKLNW
ncbi:MAG: DinB family protein [Vicinamibacterales bacterium]